MFKIYPPTKEGMRELLGLNEVKDKAIYDERKQIQEEDNECLGCGRFFDDLDHRSLCEECNEHI